MKRYVILLLSLFFAVPLAAQSRREALLEYQARRRQAYAEFQDNYRKACADFMRKRWEAFRSEAPVPLPERKEPPQPVVKQPDESAAPTQDRIPYKEVVEAPVRTVPARQASRGSPEPVSYTHLRAHETKANLVCRLLLEKKKKKEECEWAHGR